MGSLIYFELIGECEGFKSHIRLHEFRILKWPIGHGLAGLGDVHDISVLVAEMRNQPGMEFRFYLSNPNENSLLRLLHEGLQEDEFRQYVMESEGIAEGSTVWCERMDGRFYILRRTSKQERLGAAIEPVITNDRTKFVAEVGKDMSVEQTDFTRFAF